jgi:hypothetical protein
MNSLVSRGIVLEDACVRYAEWVDASPRWDRVLSVRVWPSRSVAVYEVGRPEDVARRTYRVRVRPKMESSTIP